MALRLQCPHCRFICQINELPQGTTVKCSQCGKMFGVPAVPKAAKPAPAHPCRLTIGSATSPGKVRKQNEDRFFVQHLTWSESDKYREIALVIVADGVGGYEGGEKAAAMITTQVGSALGAMVVNAMSEQAQSPAERLLKSITDALESVNRNVFEAAQANSNLKDMAATVAVVLVLDGQVLVGHVGDCRVYHYHGEQLIQVTRDQTVVERMVELGRLTPAEAAVHPARNQVSQAIGKNKIVAPATYRATMAPGDCLLVASDGLHTHVDERMLAAAIRKTGYSAGILAHELVELANQEGGTDNCTVVALLSF